MIQEFFLISFPVPAPEHLAGVLYADGYTPKEILHMMNSGSRLDFMRPTLTAGGIASDRRNNKNIEILSACKNF